jgi:hypothetical protein
MIAILEPVCAGIMVSLINKYILNGHCTEWFQQSCSAEEFREQDENEIIEAEGDEISSTNTTISDTSVHVHCH